MADPHATPAASLSLEGRPAGEVQFSAVIPCWDEEPNILPLAERLQKVFEEQIGCRDFEVIFIDNGSTDGGLELMRRLHREDPRFKYLSLSRNFGHAGAVCAGFDAARGRFVVLMDGDLQDPPEMIARFWERYRNGDLDVVYGVREKREKESFLKKLGMKWFYRVWRRTAYIHIPLDAGNFCLMNRKVVDALVTMRERGRFVPGLRAFVGFRQDGIPFVRPGRAAGEAKTNFFILSGIAIEGLLAFSVFPLRLLMITGLVAMGLAFVMAVFVAGARIGSWITGEELSPLIGNLSAAYLLLGGANMLGIGVIGEYVGRIYQEVKQRPIYVVREAGLGAGTASES